MLRYFLPLLIAGDLGCHSADWSYRNEESWGGACSTGKQQSPINLDPTKALEANQKSFKLEGYGDVLVQATIADNILRLILPEDKPHISDGPLTSDYTLDRIDFHWLSEHSIDDTKYALEVQLVHKIKDFGGTNATETNYLYAILSVMYDLVPKNYSVQNNAFDKIVEIVAGLNNGSKKSPTIKIDLMEIMGDYNSYYHYSGSHTTPNCSETVIWIVVDLVYVICDSVYKKLTNVDIGATFNYRSVQPTNDRSVYRIPCRGDFCADKLLLFSGCTSRSILVFVPAVFVIFPLFGLRYKC